MNTNTLSISVRYISLFVIIIDILSQKSSTSSLLIFWVLIFIVNNQFRYFNLKNRYKFKISSLCIDLILIYFLSKVINSISFFYFIPTIFDISFLFENKIKYIMFILTFMSCILVSINTPIFNLLENISILLIITLMSLYIYKENLNKLKYQNTYDKLRVSEDKLKRANQDLEVYINSVEELAILKERNRISREIHDSVGHSLSTTIIQLEAIKRLLKDNKALYDIVDELRDFVKDSFSEVRAAISKLKPNEYENYQNLFKIDELVKNFSKLTNTDVKLTISKNTWSLSSVQSMALYRVIQEALSNALRHGKCNKVDIFITFNTECLILTIKDNGLGCKNIVKGNGLNSISERICELKGKVEFTSYDDGFLIRASFPKNTGGNFIEQNKNFNS
jgi:signal transduction histidine kinase